MESFFTCPNCNDTLESPVILPCTHSICKKHELEASLISCTSLKNFNGHEITNSKRRGVLCRACLVFHEIPDHGFLSNALVKALIDKNVHSIDLGSEYRAATESLKVIRDILDDYKELILQPDSEIDRVISNMRNQIDLKREEAKKKIDDEAIQLIAEIDELEIKCKRSLTKLGQTVTTNEDKENLTPASASSSSSSSSSTTSPTDMIRSIESSIRVWEKELEAFDDPKKWRLIHIDMVKMSESLSKKMRPMKRKLFHESLAVVEAKKQKFCQERLTPMVQIEVVVCDLEKMRNLKSPTFSKHGVDWYVEIKYDANEDHVSIYLHVDYSVKTNRQLYIESELVILNDISPKNHMKKELKRKCAPKTGSGYACFIRLKDLKANQMYYNSVLNKFTVNANVYDIKWV